MEAQNSFPHLHLPAIVPSSYSAESNPLLDTPFFKSSVEVSREISEKKKNPVLVKGRGVTSEEF